MTAITHRSIATNNSSRIHVAECGSGPAVVLVHGFPESWYSWRYPLAALAPAIAAFKQTLPGSLGSHILEGCGHWIQQERPEETNALLLDFLKRIH
jgi:pimeloyl-ACP methyl ester carboxylesterase